MYISNNLTKIECNEVVLSMMIIEFLETYTDS